MNRKSEIVNVSDIAGDRSQSDLRPLLAFAAFAALFALAIGSVIYHQEHQPFAPDAPRETVTVEPVN